MRRRIPSGSVKREKRETHAFKHLCIIDPAKVTLTGVAAIRPDGPDMIGTKPIDTKIRLQGLQLLSHLGCKHFLHPNLI